MYRTIMKDLKDWKKSEYHPMLLLKGGIKVGKTWVLKEFGRTSFRDMLYVDCQETAYMAYIAKDNLEPERIMRMLSVYHGRKIKAGDTLLIFDEVQALPGLLAALIRLSEQVPQYYICAAGSFLDQEYPWGSGRPGKAPMVLTIKPLDFREFMAACGKDKELGWLKDTRFLMTEQEKEDMLNWLLTYAMVGGMPESVLAFRETKSLEEVRKVQGGLTEACAGRVLSLVPEDKREPVREMWEGIPRRLEFDTGFALSREEKEYLEPFIKSGLLYPVSLAKDEHHMGEDQCCLYMLDVGILAFLYGMDELPAADLFFTCHNRAMLKQLVFQELYANRNVPEIYYWQDGEDRVDFAFSDETYMIPVELAVQDNKRENGFLKFTERYHAPAGVKISRQDVNQEGKVLTIPIFGIWNL